MCGGLESGELTQKCGIVFRLRDPVVASVDACLEHKASKEHIEVQMLIGHAGNPFFADFEVEAQMDFAGAVRWIGRKRKVERRRHFAPYITPVVFHMN
jgi:hypothetical protein